MRSYFSVGPLRECLLTIKSNAKTRIIQNERYPARFARPLPGHEEKKKRSLLLLEKAKLSAFFCQYHCYLADVQFEMVINCQDTLPGWIKTTRIMTEPGPSSAAHYQQTGPASANGPPLRAPV